MFELIIKGVFQEIMPATRGPNVPLFKSIEEFWPEIDHSKYKWYNG